MQGHLPLHDDTPAFREAKDDEPFSALAFKVATDPYVGRLTFFRVYSGSLKSGSYVYNSTKDKRERVGRLLQMHANKREEIEEVLGGRHRRRHRPEGHPDRRHAVRRGQADHPRGDEVPEPRHRRGDRAEDQGGPGQADDRAAEAAGGGSDVPGPDRRRDRRRRSSPGMGELHLEILVDRMKREFKVEANVGRPQVAYPRDDHASGSRTSRASSSGSRAARASTATSSSTSEPADVGQGFVFEDKIVGGVDPPGVHQAGRGGHQRGAGERRAGRLPGGGRQGDAGVRQLPRRGLERNGVQDRRLDGLQGSGADGAPGPARTGHGGRGGEPRPSSWATSSATCRAGAARSAA